MKLSERLGREVPEADRPRPARLPSAQPERVAVADPLGDLKQRAQAVLFERLGGTLASRGFTSADLRREVNAELDVIIANAERLLSAEERREVVDAVADNLLGLGPIQPLLDDPEVTEIMVNKPDEVYVERNGRLERTNLTFHSEAHVRAIIERIVTGVGRRIDESKPMVDARLPDGSRVNAVLPPLTIDSPTLTIRKFSTTRLGIEDLIAGGTLSEAAAMVLEAAVAGRASVVVSGGTGSGKTTLLNVLSSFIPEGERIITIEDTAELQLQQAHVVRMEQRAANIEGLGAATTRDLLINALRMRPDRILVGECRGAETFDMLQAMNTGHEGSLTTLHANSPRDAIARMETMILMAGMELPHRAVREQIASAVDIVVQLSRLADGTRRVVQICEIAGMEGDVVQMNDIYKFAWDAGRDPETGRFRGGLEPTGIRPSFSAQLEAAGYPLPGELFSR